MLETVNRKERQKGCGYKMKNTIAACITMAALGLALTASAQVPAGRIVTIDLNKVFNDYYKTPIASAKLKETADSFNKEHDDMMAGYKKEIDELNKLRDDQDKPEYTADVREQKRKAVADKLTETQKMQRDIDDYRTSHRKILEEQTQRMRQTILKEIQDVVDKEARDAGYLLVIDKSGNTLNGVPGNCIQPGYAGNHRRHHQDPEQEPTERRRGAQASGQQGQHEVSVQLTARDIARMVRGELSGSPDQVVTGLAGLREATPNDVSFLASPKYQAAAKATHARVLIAARDLPVDFDGVVIRVDNPSEAFAELVRQVAPPPVTFPPGIHPTAVVASTARLGKDVLRSTARGD